MKIIACFSIYFFFLVPVSIAQPKYEFRAVWIATVDNIDWPSRGNYNSDSQKAEFRKILDMHQANGMNAVIVQIRPATDALYPSSLEPWSEWLTGKQGQPPSPYYDPLQFMIDETHKRGMEFHAWCNPYRAEFQIGKSTIAASHITKIHPEWFLTYGGVRYFDPGNKDAQHFVVNVIRDIVRRYDIDALHFDDYFYPYRIQGREFPDQASFAKYGGNMSKEDWRRSNVDSIIMQLSKAIKEENKFCQFGISPFGVWRNRDRDSLGSDTKAGQTNYDDLYADILLWLREGWIDYVAPQLYWEFGHRAAPYEILLDWWSRRSYGRYCYIGIGAFKAGSNAIWRDKTLLPRQIKATRNYSTVQGQIYFSSKTFETNPNGWSDSLRNNYYHRPSLIAPMNWLDSSKPVAPGLVVSEIVSQNQPAQYRMTISLPDSAQRIKNFALYALDTASTALVERVAPFEIIPAKDSLDYDLSSFFSRNGNGFGNQIFVTVTSISRTNNESEAKFLLQFKRANSQSSWQMVK